MTHIKYIVYFVRQSRGQITLHVRLEWIKERGHWEEANASNQYVT